MTDGHGFLQLDRPPVNGHIMDELRLFHCSLSLKEEFQLNYRDRPMTWQ